MLPSFSSFLIWAYRVRALCMGLGRFVCVSPTVKVGSHSPLTLTLSHSLPHSLTLTITLTHLPSLSQSHSPVTHSHTRTHSLILSLTHTAHTHTRTHTTHTQHKVHTIHMLTVSMHPRMVCQHRATVLRPFPVEFVCFISSSNKSKPPV